MKLFEVKSLVNGNCDLIASAVASVVFLFSVLFLSKYVSMGVFFDILICLMSDFMVEMSFLYFFLYEIILFNMYRSNRFVDVLNVGLISSSASLKFVIVILILFLLIGVLILFIFICFVSVNDIVDFIKFLILVSLKLFVRLVNFVKSTSSSRNLFLFILFEWMFKICICLFLLGKLILMCIFKWLGCKIVLFNIFFLFVISMSKMLFNASTSLIFVSNWLIMELCMFVLFEIFLWDLYIVLILLKIMMCKLLLFSRVLYSVSAFLNNLRTFFFDCLMYLDIIFGLFMIFGFLLFNIFLICFVIRVLFVFGGLWRSIFLTCWISRRCITFCGKIFDENVCWKMFLNCWFRFLILSLEKLKFLFLNNFVFIIVVFWFKIFISLLDDVSYTTVVDGVNIFCSDVMFFFVFFMMMWFILSK